MPKTCSLACLAFALAGLGTAQADPPTTRMPETTTSAMNGSVLSEETRIGVTSAAHSSRLKGRLAGMPVDDSVNGRSAAGQPANYHIDANRDRLSAERPFEPFCGAD